MVRRVIAAALVDEVFRETHANEQISSLVKILLGTTNNTGATLGVATPTIELVETCLLDYKEQALEQHQVEQATHLSQTITTERAMLAFSSELALIEPESFN